MIVKVHSFAEEGSNRPPAGRGAVAPEKWGSAWWSPCFWRSRACPSGDTIRLDTGTGDFEDALARREFTIVGTADSLCISPWSRGSSSLGTGGGLSLLFCCRRQPFPWTTTPTPTFGAEGAEELLCYSEDYTELVNSLSDALEPLAEERSALRGVHPGRGRAGPGGRPAGSCLTGRRRCLEELSEGEAELTDARRELDDGWAEYYDGLNTFEQETADAQREIDDGEAELADALTELRDGGAGVPGCPARAGGCPPGGGGRPAGAGGRPGGAGRRLGGVPQGVRQI